MAPKSELARTARRTLVYALTFGVLPLLASCSESSSDSATNTTDAETESDSPREEHVDAGVPTSESDADDAGGASSSGMEPDAMSALPDAGSGAAELDEEILSTLRTLRYSNDPPPEDPSNAFADDARARLLGQRLFFDPSLSGPLIEGDNDGSGGTLGMMGEAGRISCASCHVPEDHFVDTRSPHRQISLAALWTQRRAPTLLEVAYAPLYNWDGRRDSIWGQAIGVMESEREFNSSRVFVAQQVVKKYRAEYTVLFGEPPPVDDAEQFEQMAAADAGCSELTSVSGVSYECRGKPGDNGIYDTLDTEGQAAVTGVMVNAAKAIAAYVRQLRCGESRFDAWLDGDATALTASEQRGAALFAGKAQCTECHSGPNLTDGAFHNVGLRPGVVAVAFTDTDDHGASAALPLLAEDPLNTRGAFSDGERDVVLDDVGPALEGAFRTPTLRCISEQPSFMHTGQLTSLQSVVGFFSRGGDRPGGYPGVNELHALDLSESEQADLVAFLSALDGPGPDTALLSAPSEGSK